MTAQTHVISVRLGSAPILYFCILYFILICMYLVVKEWRKKVIVMFFYINFLSTQTP